MKIQGSPTTELLCTNFKFVCCLSDGGSSIRLHAMFITHKNIVAMHVCLITNYDYQGAKGKAVLPL